MVARKLVLEQIDPKKDTGIFDPQVFKGGNSLSVIMNPQTTMWTFKMERGLVPGALRDRFTDFNSALKHAREYFATKSIKIVDVV